MLKPSFWLLKPSFPIVSQSFPTHYPSVSVRLPIGSRTAKSVSIPITTAFTRTRPCEFPTIGKQTNQWNLNNSASVCTCVINSFILLLLQYVFSEETPLHGRKMVLLLVLSCTINVCHSCNSICLLMFACQKKSKTVFLNERNWLAKCWSTWPIFN